VDGSESGLPIATVEGSTDLGVAASDTVSACIDSRWQYGVLRHSPVQRLALPNTPETRDRCGRNAVVSSDPDIPALDAPSAGPSRDEPLTSAATSPVCAGAAHELRMSNHTAIGQAGADGDLVRGGTCVARSR